MRRRATLLTARLTVGALLLAACSTSAGPAASGSPASPATSASPSGGFGSVVPAPGSSSAVYGPNPGAIVVAIDPGHGGCLDWGVPDPRQRGPAFAEKVMTLAIATELARQLEAQGISAVLTRNGDYLLAGDVSADHGCHGESFRDVNSDGRRGFDGGATTRAHDEMQARIDLVNLARADVLVSIHINSLTENGATVQIAATETFYNDQTSWGAAGGKRLSGLAQAEVVAAMAAIAAYPRQDRGSRPSTYYILTPPIFVPTPEQPDPAAEPARGLLMPGILSEVGAINLPAEQDLLLSAAGQSAIAAALVKAIAAYLADRPRAVRYDALVPNGGAGTLPTAVAGTAPPFWLPTSDPAMLAAGIPVRLTNIGSRAWPSGLRAWAGWALSDQPYLREAPALTELEPAIPSLAPGESVEILLSVAVPKDGQRWIAWITLAQGGASVTEFGSPPLQIAVSAP